MTTLMSAIYKGRHDCLKENEAPRDVLIGVDLRNALLREVDPLRMQLYGTGESVCGMHIEWKKAGFGISIRTAAGDLKRVNSSTFAKGEK